MMHSPHVCLMKKAHNCKIMPIIAYNLEMRVVKKVQRQSQDWVHVLSISGVTNTYTLSWWLVHLIELTAC